MTTSIVFTFIGSDKPGLIETLSNTVSAHGGNWQESRMSQLSGRFAGIAHVQINAESATDLSRALEQLSSDDLNVVVQTCDDASDNGHYRHHELSLIGNDRPNIIKEVSRALAAHRINVCRLNTEVISAPMTAQALFKASVQIQTPASVDLHHLSDELDAIAEQLDVDIRLEH